MLLPVVCLCGLRPRTREIISKQYCMSLRTAMVVFVKCRRSESKCFFRSYVFADCDDEDKEKIQKQYCMSLRTAMVVFVKCRRSESKCCFRSYVFADCGYEDKEKISKQYCMSLRTALVVFVKCRRSESKCFFRSYVFADCGHEHKRKSQSNIVCLCGLQWLCLLSVGDLKVNVSSGRMSLRTAATKTRENLKARLYVFADCNGCVW